MKSLNFNKLNIQQEDILSKTQMKNILGGHGGSGGPCKVQCEYYDPHTGTNKFGACSEVSLPGVGNLPPSTGCSCDAAGGSELIDCFA